MSIATATVQFSTLSDACNYAVAAHIDAVEAVDKARAALQAALTVEQDTAIIKSTLNKLREESQ